MIRRRGIAEFDAFVREPDRPNRHPQSLEQIRTALDNNAHVRHSRQAEREAFGSHRQVMPSGNMRIPQMHGLPAERGAPTTPVATVEDRNRIRSAE